MEYLIPSLDALEGVDLLLLAGDITDRDNIRTFKDSIELMLERVDAPVLSVFGNEEYMQSHDRYREILPGTFLEEETATVEIEGLQIRVVGTQGSLDRPTWWQRNNIPGIWRSYGERVERVSELLEPRDEDMLIFLSHYPPTTSTMEGEDPGRYEEMSSRAMEGILELRRPDLVIHGHVHRGRREGRIGGGQTSLEDFGSRRREIPIFNVALPLVKGATVIEARREDDGFHFTRV
jgi:Icc-related predicted phosphoesterase